MRYKTLADCVNDLEKHGHLIRIKEEVDPNLEMAAIHLRVFEANGPALLFENIKGCKFKAVSNLFGTLERSRFIFRHTLTSVQQLIEIKNKPDTVFKQPLKSIKSVIYALNALPKKSNLSFLKHTTTLDQLPQIKCWSDDGGAFITLPQVYTEDILNPGVMSSNLGMYRIQLSGNEYEKNKEIGLHYQLHRGIGVHQTNASNAEKPLKVSIFVGGPPSHTFSAVMPLPENISELTFAGALGGRRFRYCYDDEGFAISSEADFVITGEVITGENKPEGPFGDHLGYYSLKHDFPVMRVKQIYHKKDAIWPFTVVGRPPQEDTQFGALIHEITGSIIPKEIPGLHEVNAVDAAGVHPLLLAMGSERYTPYNNEQRPQELLTIANHILGFGQMSLAKYVIIAAKDKKETVSVHKEEGFLKYVLERVDWTHDLHFYTNTTIDTLDYSGSDLNSGSKVVIAAAGDKKRELGTDLDFLIRLPDSFSNPKIIFPGVLAVKGSLFSTYEKAEQEFNEFSNHFKFDMDLKNKFPLIVVTDDSDFIASSVKNFLWVTFTRSNPSQDIYGVDAFTHYKHWGCNGSLLIDARVKPHHAPLLIKDYTIEKQVDALGEKGKSLYGII